MEDTKLSINIVTELFNNAEIMEEEKKNLIDKIIENSNELNLTNRYSVFSSVLSYMLNNNNNKLWKTPIYANTIFGRKYPNDMLAYLQCDNFLKIFHNAEKSRLNILLLWLHKSLMDLVESIGGKLSLPRISATLFEKMENNKKNSIIVGQIASILHMCPVLLPTGQKVFKLSNSILYMVADFPIPTKPQTHKHMVDIGELLNILWKRISLDDLKSTLVVLYQIISNTDSSEVCPAMAHILSLVGEGMVSILGPRLVNSSQTSSSLPFTATLTRLSNWLISWPYAACTLNYWIKTLVKLLCQSGKYTIPKNTAIQQISKLIEALRIPVCRDGAYNGIVTFLMSYQVSPDIFVQVIPQLVEVMLILKHEDTPSSRQTLLRFGELCQAQMTIHRIEHESYQRHREILKMPQWDEENVNKLIEDYNWASVNTTVVESFELKSRGISQKIGLGNLGNTCYMNSIIQALFMTDSFRTSVIQSRVAENQPLLTNLRHLFVLLCFSSRNFISPVLFHNSSRPPWFQAGMQHDCSEYLRHLLTALYEEEKLTGPSDSTEPMNINSETASLASDLQLLPEDNDLDGACNFFAESDAAACLQKATINGERTECKMEVETSPKSGMQTRSAAASDLASKTEAPNESEGGDCIMDFENSADSFGSSCKRKQSSPDVAGSPLGKALKGDLQTCGGETDSASDSGISGDLTDEKDYAASHNGDEQGDVLQTDRRRKVADDEFATLVHKVFGGIISTTIKCLNCKTNSVHEDIFTDINLAFQDIDHGGSVSSKKMDNCQSKCDLTIEQMISNYLKTETLSGDNQYECDQCNGKQDADRSLRIIEAPDHLILTQLRFFYDLARGQRQKVFTKVNFREDLLLPMCQPEAPLLDSNDYRSTSSDDNSPSTDASAAKELPSEIMQAEAYTLYAVVVHSGVSSEGGHYYCFARSSSLASVLPQERCGGLGDWYNFNDEDVTQTSFENISRLASTFTRDTAYVLFYQKVGDLKYSNSANSIEDISTSHFDIKDIIESDNRLFQSEMERMHRKPRGDGSYRKNPRQDPPQPPPPPGNCGNGGGVNMSPSIIY